MFLSLQLNHLSFDDTCGMDDLFMWHGWLGTCGKNELVHMIRVPWLDACVKGELVYALRVNWHIF